MNTFRQWLEFTDRGEVDADSINNVTAFGDESPKIGSKYMTTSSKKRKSNFDPDIKFGKKKKEKS